MTPAWLTDMSHHVCEWGNQCSQGLLLGNTSFLTQEHLLSTIRRRPLAKAVALVTCIINGVDWQSDMPLPLCFIIAQSDFPPPPPHYFQCGISFLLWWRGEWDRLRCMELSWLYPSVHGVQASSVCVRPSFAFFCPIIFLPPFSSLPFFLFNTLNGCIYVYSSELVLIHLYTCTSLKKDIYI